MANFDAVNEAAVNEVGAATEDTVLSIFVEQIVHAPITLETVVEQVVYATLPDFNAAQTVRPHIELAGVDISALLVDAVTVKAEEGQARVAAFAYSPAAGTIDTDVLFGAVVTVDHDVLDSTGAVTYRQRRFTGFVDVPVFDPRSGRITCECSDQLQRTFNERTNEQITAIVPQAPFSSALQGDDLVGFEFMRALEETLPGSIDLDPFGNPRYTPWDSSSTTGTYTAGQIADESELADMSAAASAINTIDATFEYRYMRLIERREQGSWDHPAVLGGFCSYLTAPTDLPNRDMVISALYGTGWIPTSVAFNPIPIGQVFVCSPDILWAAPQALVDQLILGATWTLKKRFYQRVTERHEITVAAPESIAGRGARKKLQRGGFTADFDPAPWVAELGEDSVLMIDTTQLGTTGDYYEDRDDVEGFDRDQVASAQQRMIQAAHRELLLSHRQTLVGFDLMIEPTIDLDQRLRLNTARIQATGKVKRFECIYDLAESRGNEDSRTRTKVQIAISRRFTPPSITVGVDPNPVLELPPDPINTDPANIPALSVQVRGNQFGGLAISDPFDDTNSGFSGNFTGPLYPEAGAEIYPVRFSIDSPEIDAVDTDDNEVTIESEYTYTIPNDEFVLVAP